MTSVRRDPLLGGTDWLLTAMLFLLGFAVVALALALPVVWGAYGGVFGGAVKARVTSDPHLNAGATSAVMVGGLAICAIGFAFTRELRAIVRTVAAGSPFTASNAERLTRMGWLAVAGHVTAAVLAGFVWWLGDAAGTARDGWNIELSGVVLALVLFILARVFRQGAAMRADLEGTI